MNWRMLLSGLLMSLTIGVFARCENLSGLDRLACEKSAHKIKGGSRAQPSTAGNPNAGRPIANAIDPERPSRSGKKAKLRLPNNRRIGAREQSAHERSKKRVSSQNKAKADQNVITMVPNTGVNPLADAGLVSAGSTDALDSDASDMQLALPAQSMLASDVALDSAPSTIGDDALYRIY